MGVKGVTRQPRNGAVETLNWRALYNNGRGVVFSLAAPVKINLKDAA